jgi:hypothetical protein
MQRFRFWPRGIWIATAPLQRHPSTHSPRRTWRSPRAVSARRSSRLLRLIHRLQGTGGCAQGRGVDRYVPHSPDGLSRQQVEPTSPFPKSSDGLNCVLGKQAPSTTAHSTIPHTLYAMRFPRPACWPWPNIDAPRTGYFQSPICRPDDTHGLQTTHTECAVDSHQIAGNKAGRYTPGRTIRFNLWTCRIPPLVPSRPSLVTLASPTPHPDSWLFLRPMLSSPTPPPTHARSATMPQNTSSGKLSPFPDPCSAHVRNLLPSCWYPTPATNPVPAQECLPGSVPVGSTG